ncbi:MAG: sporulation protein YqfD [Lachnospiraceae bacterium]|nr:sporulation protein YqfD [Lachnospiraceae bacterium]
MLQFIRFLKGYLLIRVCGNAPERFINLCSNHQIFLWDIQIHEAYYTMKIGLSDFYRIKGFTRKTGTKVVVTERFGLPFLSVGMKKRKVFLAGIVISLGFWLLMSAHIWTIQLTGNYYITEDVFMDFLTENGIVHGMKKSKVPVEDLEKAIRNEFPIVTWTSVKVDGSKLLIQIKENELLKEEDQTKEQVKATEKGFDLVAQTDGTIVSIVTRSGVPLVQEGQEVKKGDILVQGAIPILSEDGTVRRYEFCEADADIMLECRKTYVEEVPLFYREKNYSGREKKRSFVEIGAHRIRFSIFGTPYEEYDQLEQKKEVILFHTFHLPIYYGNETIREYTGSEKNYTKDEIKEIFAHKILKIIQTLEEKGVQITGKNVTMKKNEKKWKMEAEFLLIEPAGALQETGIGEIEEQNADEQSVEITE